MSDPDSNIALIRRLYEQVHSGRFDNLAALITDDFELDEAAGLPFGGVWRGKQSLQQALEHLLPILRAREIRVNSITANADEVVALLDLVFDGDDGDFVMPVAEYFRIRDGLVSRIRPYFFDTARLNAFLADRG